ncbi:polar amino acid transport system substrate-binding protein [Pseudomonas sp. NFACC32-1]|uniref:substrate-binding periplasmic protein n=1 Tax=Pseudomonas TaxID=286 RepID=UPI0008774C58|nr:MULTISPECIES: transporter substrate-binding domain-containing protein [Pseudomonas]NHN68494.1 amino acid ABC transporter substrate-binding protein [Pseudomonas fluorescens]SCX71832.1 polar amino acid transport system substrate-binding protein [Pseudomonas sp. NFACC32-1]SFY03368.1 polar amino acid transport system substrate-binding protein [Pseudomonas sp. NFACC49-2]SIS26433.1 amino acid ABC transporter substrate-binding protein, PAAT family [Pseudomonas sp. 7SR1]
MSRITCVSNARAKVLCRLSLLLTLLGLCTAHGAPLPIELHILDAPPLTFVDDPKGHGIVGDIAIEAMIRAGYAVKIHVLPWARAQKHVSEEEDHLIAPLSRIPVREDRFTWIAPIMSMERAFFTLDRQVASFAQARETFRKIGVGLGSAQEAILRAEGFDDDQIYTLTIGDNPAQMLLMGRIDAWFNGVPESRYIWPKVSDRKLLMSSVGSSADIYLACSRKCSAKMVRDLRQAVEAMRQDGTFSRVQAIYQPR